MNLLARKDFCKLFFPRTSIMSTWPSLPLLFMCWYFFKNYFIFVISVSSSIFVVHTRMHPPSVLFHSIVHLMTSENRRCIYIYILFTVLMMTLASSIKSPSYKLTVHKVKLKLHASSKLKQFSSLTATDRALENGWEKI